MFPTDHTAENLRATEARQKKIHDKKGALGVPPSKPGPDRAARAEILTVVNSYLKPMA